MSCTNAWYIKFLSTTTYDFNSIPAFVRQNIMFQYMIYNYFNVKNLYESISQMKALSMLPDIKDYNPKDVTINNFHESIFYSNVFFSDYLQNYYFTFHSLNEGNVEILKTLEVLLKKNVSAINGSELEKKYETLFFLNAYVKYILTKELRYISEMRDRYLKLESKNDILALLCANVLQLNEQIDYALEILNNSELNQSNIFFLKAYCFLRKNDKIKYSQAIKDWINTIDEIDNSVVDSYLASTFTLKGIGETDELKLSDFIQNKTFENQELKTLVETIVNSLISGDYILNTLLVFEDKEGTLLTDDFVYFKFNLAQIKFSMGTEQYVKSVLGDEHPALFEFVKNKYKGYTLTTKQLLDEFNKKINSQDNYYTNCLENISMASAIPCIKLVNTITQSQLDITQQEIDIKNVFVNMLKGGPLNNAIIQNFEMLIFVELNYSQEKLNFVGQCLEDVYQILGITDNVTQNE